MSAVRRKPAELRRAFDDIMIASPAWGAYIEGGQAGEGLGVVAGAGPLYDGMFHIVIWSGTLGSDVVVGASPPGSSYGIA